MLLLSLFLEGAKTLTIIIIVILIIKLFILKTDC